jgi:DNA-binding GntR family transcriptional regulator
MTELATQALREGIFNGQYLPGSRLKPVQLEQDMDLGRVAIREALRELAGSGLVKSIPNKGIQVAMPPSTEQMSLLYECRCILEGNLGLQATDHIRSRDLAILEELYEKMNNKNLLPKDHFLLNRDFHLTLYEASGWEHSCRLVGQMLDQVLAFYAFHAQDVAVFLDFEPFNKEHAEIIEYLKAKNGNKVKKTITANILRGHKLLKQVSAEMGKSAGTASKQD